MPYFPPNPNGQTVKAGSSPFVLATEQEAILQSISDNIQYLKDNPTTGGSSETTLTSIKDVLDDLLTELNLKGDLGETQPVSVTTLPLPSGASTASNQSDIKTLLSDLKSKNDLLLAELELKASLSETQPVSVSGVSTEATLALIKAKTDNLDVLLSSRTKPTDTQPVSVSSLPLPTGSATESTLALIKTNTDKLDVLLSTIKGLTDTELRASPLALPTGASTSDNQTTTNSLITTSNVELAKLHDVIFEAKSTGFYRGKIAYNFNISGKRSSFTSITAFNDVGEGLGVSGNANFAELTGAETLQLISTNANDTSGGTGVRSVKVLYINTSNNLVQSAAITLNGTTAVSVGFSALAVIWIESVTVGSNLGAVGNVSLRTSTPLILTSIIANGNKSRDTFFMIPTGFTGYVYGWSGGAISNDQDIRLRATIDSFTSTISVPYHFQDNMYISSGQNRSHGILVKLPELSKVKISTITASTAGAVRVDAGFDILLIGN